MSSMIPGAIRAIQDLCEKMNAALQAGAIEDFIDFADERSQALRSYFGGDPDAGSFNAILSEAIAQDRQWISRLHALLAAKKEEIEQVQRKKHGQRQLARAYSHPSAQGRLLTRRS